MTISGRPDRGDGGDALDLGRVLANLVDNALRHTTAPVVVELRTEGADAILTVTDDGPGIPEPDRERVFDRFTRLDSARSRDEGGAGLGLAIVRETVHAHGGAVHLEDASPGCAWWCGCPAGDRCGIRRSTALGGGGALLGRRHEVLGGRGQAAAGVHHRDDVPEGGFEGTDHQAGPGRLLGHAPVPEQ